MPEDASRSTQESLRKVLVVDDDSAVTNYLTVLLAQTERYEAIVINDSRKIGELLDEPQFDILLLDMDMPDLDGIDIINNMCERGLDIPVVVLTGVHDVGLAVKAMKYGVFDYLIKPVDDEKLIGVLDAAIARNK